MRETIVRKSFEKDLVADTDESGALVGHDVNRVQRSCDALFRSGALTEAQYTAACLLRDNWERARLLAGARASDLNKIKGTPESDKRDALWERHKACLRSAGAAKAMILSAIVLHDGTPAAQQRAQPLARLESALNWLVAWCEAGHLDRVD